MDDTSMPDEPRFYVVDNEVEAGVEWNGATGRYVVIDRESGDAWHFQEEMAADNVAFALNHRYVVALFRSNFLLELAKQRKQRNLSK